MGERIARHESPKAKPAIPAMPSYLLLPVRQNLIHELQVMCLLTRGLSYESIARTMHLTPNAIGGALMKLTRFVGVPLSEVRVRRANPTEEARQLAVECEPLLMALLETLLKYRKPRGSATQSK